MRSVIFLTCLFMGGCISPLKTPRIMPEAEPAWYTARRTEIVKQGYIPLASTPSRASCDRIEKRPQDVVAYGADIPVSGMQSPDDKGTVSPQNRQVLARALQQFEDDPRNQGARENGEALQAWAEHHQQAFQSDAGMIPDFLTDDDVEAIKAVFDTPRGQP